MQNNAINRYITEQTQRNKTPNTMSTHNTHINNNNKQTQQHIHNHKHKQQHSNTNTQHKHIKHN